METLFRTLLLTSIFAFPALAAAESSHQHNGMKMQHETMKKQNAVMGAGVVHTIDSDNHKINLTHEPIPELKWPEMTMDLDVAESVDLTAIKPGDAITFHIVLGDDKVYRITEITSNNAEHNHTH
ncbi:MAG: copper-binding protein [Alphaproteobacteria bacterium]|nr:copper-binding protein [Alphaproteobacteria bacterium]